MGTDHTSSLSRVGPGLGLQLRQEPRDAVCVPRLPRPRLDAVAHVPSAALFVGGEGGAPYALRGGELCAVPVCDVAYALGGQRVANVSPFPPALDQAPCVSTRLRIIWLTRPSETPSQVGKVLAEDHRVVGDEVQRPLLRRADAEGRRRLRHTLRDGAGMHASAPVTAVETPSDRGCRGRSRPPACGNVLPITHEYLCNTRGEGPGFRARSSTPRQRSSHG